MGDELGDSSYNSCFYVAPPPKNVHRVYHNRKKTAYTDYIMESAPHSAPCLTLLQLLASEESPSRAAVCKVAYAQGDATEESNLVDVLETPDQRGWVPLLIATRQRQVEAVAALLSLGASPNCLDPQTGCTPLVVAVTFGDQHIVQCLLDHRACMNTFTGPDQRNALCEAIFSRRSDILDMLLYSGGDMEIVAQVQPGLATIQAQCHKGRAVRIYHSMWMPPYWSMLLGFRWHMVVPTPNATPSGV